MPAAEDRSAIPANLRLPLPRLTAVVRLGAAGRLALLPAGAALYLVLRPPVWLPAEAAAPAALAIAAIGLWATGALPGHVTAIAFFVAAMLFHVASPEVVFSGFGSAAFWLIFGGLVMGAAIEHTGLAVRLAGRVAVRFGGGYGALVAGLTAVGVGLGFVMPSSVGRAVVLVPVALALAERLGFGPGSNGRTALVLAAAFGSHLPTFAILPSNIPNMVLAATAERLYGVHLEYGRYLLLHFPVLGLVKAAVIALLIVRLYPDRPAPLAASAPVPLSGRERRLMGLLALSLLLWSTDSLTHIAPAWVALGGALVCLLPSSGLLPPRAFNELNHASLFYVAGIMGLGTLVGHSGVSGVLSHALLALLPLTPDAPVQQFAALAAASTVTGLFTTLPGTPAVLTPLAGDLAQAAGLPVATVLMAQVLGFSTVELPYQSAPLVIAIQLGGVRFRDAARLCLLLTLITVIFLLPLDHLWWRLLGWL